MKSFTSWQARPPARSVHRLAIDWSRWTISSWHVVNWRCLNNIVQQAELFYKHWTHKSRIYNIHFPRLLTSITNLAWLMDHNFLCILHQISYLFLHAHNFKCQLPNEQAWGAALHACSTKGNLSNLVVDLSQTHIFDQYVVECGSKSRHHKDMCSKESHLILEICWPWKFYIRHEWGGGGEDFWLWKIIEAIGEFEKINNCWEDLIPH